MPKRQQREPLLAGKTVAILCDYTFEDMEVMYPKLRLEEEGATVEIVGVHPKGQKYSGKHGYPITSTKSASDVDSSESWAALILPGGFAPDYMRRSQKLLALTSEMLAAGKPVAAICHGPWMLCSARRADGTPACKGHRATGFVAIKDDVVNAGAEWCDEPVVVSEAVIGGVREVVITSRTPNDLTPFCHAIIDAIQ